MERLVELPEEDIRWLDQHSRAGGPDRATLLHEAVTDLKAKLGDGDPHAWLEAGFGLWRGRNDIPDGVEYQRAMRAEWDREWDAAPDPAE